MVTPCAGREREADGTRRITCKWRKIPKLHGRQDFPSRAHQPVIRACGFLSAAARVTSAPDTLSTVASPLPLLVAYNTGTTSAPHRDLTVVPLIAYQRYDGEVPVWSRGGKHGVRVGEGRWERQRRESNLTRICQLFHCKAFGGPSYLYPAISTQASAGGSRHFFMVGRRGFGILLLRQTQVYELLRTIKV